MNKNETIAIKDIKINLLDKDLNDERILAMSVALKNGHLNDVPTLLKEEDGYRIIKGEMLVKAAIINGFDSIDANVAQTDDHAEITAVIVDSLKRNHPDAISEAKQLVEVMKDEDITQAELASRLGLKQSTVANKLRLLKLPDYIQEAIIDGRLTERHGRALLKLSDEQLPEVFKTVIERNYNVAKTEEYLKALNKRGNRGVSNNVRIGINTLKEAFELCQKSGLDCTFNTRENDDDIKVIISFKK